ncbi:MAG: hypothetical protein K2X82_26580 [Gemmataceae bacterium]|nr:hypothetical protein [Gemmataceae bacterium]
MPLPLVVCLLAAGLPAHDLPDREPLPPGASARFGSLRYRVPFTISAAALSTDGKLLAVAGTAAVRVYAVPAWEVVHEWPTGGGTLVINPRPFAFSPDGRWLAYNQSGERVQFYDLATGAARTGQTALGGGGFGALFPLAAFTPDGLYATANDRRLVVLDPATRLPTRSVPVRGVVHLSPDGKTFARLDRPEQTPGGPPVGVVEPGEVVLGDAATGKDTVRLGVTARGDSLHDGVAFAPDGKTVAVVPADRDEVRVIDPGTGKARAVLRLPGAAYPDKTRPVQFSISGTADSFDSGFCGPDVGFTPDGKELWVRLASADIARWDAATLRELPALRVTDWPRPSSPGGEMNDERHGGWPRPGGLSALPDGRTLLTPCGNGWVRVWDRATGAEVPVPGRYSGRLGLAVAPGGTTVAVTDGGGQLDLCDAQTGRVVRRLRGPAPGGSWPGPVFSPDGRHLAVGESHVAKDGKSARTFVRVLRVADGGDEGTAGFVPDNPYFVAPLGFAADGRVVTKRLYRPLGVWDVATGRLGWAAPADRGGAAVSPDGRHVAVGDGPDVAILDAATGREERRLPGVGRPPVEREHRQYHLYPAWAAAGRSLVVTAPGDWVTVVDAATGRVRSRFRGGRPNPDPDWVKDRDGTRADENWVGPASLSPDGRWVLTTRPPALWEVATGDLVRTFPVRTDPWQCDAAFTPDGRAVVTAAGPGVGYRWEVAAPVRGPKPPPADLWASASRSAKAGVPAALALMASAGGRELVRQKLPPAPPDPGLAGRVSGWIADLGSDDFATREAASKGLAARARAAEPALRDALRTADNPEVRRRLDAALRSAATSRLTPDEVRAGRMVQAAELLDTADTRALLTGWAGGAAGAVLTEEAKAALGRLSSTDRK